MKTVALILAILCTSWPLLAQVKHGNGTIVSPKEVSHYFNQGQNKDVYEPLIIIPENDTIPTIIANDGTQFYLFKRKKKVTRTNQKSNIIRF